MDLPFSGSEVKLFHDDFIITTSDEAWIWNSGTQQWDNLGAYPGTSSVEPTTWGKLKTQYQDDSSG